MAQSASNHNERTSTEHLFFAKGSRVEFVYQGKTQYGTVEKVGRTGKVSVLTDDDNRLSGTSQCFRPSSKPAPERERKICPFRIGDRVECTNPRDNAVIVGTVKGFLDGERISVTLDDGSGFRWHWKYFRPNATVAPRIVNPFVVGDRVETDEKNGSITYGTVISVRDYKITMEVDGGIGSTIRGPFKLFRPSNKPVPAPVKRKFVREDCPCGMDAYSVTKFKATPVRKGVWEGHEGNGYHAIVARDGKNVLEAYNEGVGGCGRIAVLPGNGQPADAAAFMGSLKHWYVVQWGRECDAGEDLIDVWVEWYHFEKPKGKYGWEVVAELHAICEKFRK